MVTPRNPSLRTEGSQVGIVARRLGTPLTPMQQYVADVAGERRPDGEYEHQVVVWTVPRQTGKTVGLRSIGVHRAAILGRDVFYTAQTGKHARARWMDLVEILLQDPAYKSRIKLALRGGAEAATFKRPFAGGAFSPFAPTSDGMHSFTPPTVFVDEAFAHSLQTGELLMGAISPAQQTILDRQLWIVSTMGTAESVWFHDWVERAAAGMPRVALFDWGARDDQDPYDLADIAAFHPGVGNRFDEGKLLTAQDVLDEAARVGRSEYERAYANRRTLTRSLLIPAEAVTPLEDPDVPAPADPRAITLAADVAYDRSAGTILAIWDHDHRPHARILQHRPGTAWMTPALRRYARSWRSRLTATAHGPITNVTDDLHRRGDHVELIPTSDWPTASTGFLNDVDDQVFTLHPDTELLAGIAGLAVRNAGDQLVLSRRLSVGDTSAAFALAAALHTHTAQPTGRIITRHRST